MHLMMTGHLVVLVITSFLYIYISPEVSTIFFKTSICCCLVNVQGIHCCPNSDLGALLIHLLVINSADFASPSNTLFCPPAFSSYTPSFFHLLTHHLFSLLFNPSFIFIINSHHNQGIFIVVGESHNHIDKMLIHLKFREHF